VSTLFRPQAIDHQRHRLHGTIVLARTWSYTVLVAFLCAVVLALCVFAAFFGFTRKDVVLGVVTPVGGLIRVAAPQAGALVAVHVTEGQVVQAGDALFTLSSERASSQGNTQGAINQSLAVRTAALRAEIERRAQQGKNRQVELAQRQRSLKASLAQHESELALQGRRAQLAREVATRWADLAAQGAQTGAAAKDKAADALEQEAKLAALKRAGLVLERELAELAGQLSDLPLQTAREASTLAREIEEIKQQLSESEARRELLVRAEQPGRVAGIVGQLGQSVEAGNRLAQLLPTSGALEAELYAPTRAIAFVKPGTPVQLRYEAFPFQKYGQQAGTVREVAISAVPLGELTGRRASTADNTAGAAEPMYRIRVQLAAQEVTVRGQHYAIRPGMQLAASLVLEHRTLIEWALEPLAGIAQRL
jgi:membrane fusion protein